MFFYFLWDRYKRVGWSILVLLVLTNAILTYERNKVWASDYTLWADCLKKSPSKPRALSNYGKTLADAGHASEALVYYDKAIKINPRFYAAYCNRGAAYDALGNYKQAIEDLDRAIEINPKYADAYKNRGIAYNSLGNHNQAIADFKIASRLGDKASQGFLRRQGIDW
jgi:tetratricopeptide (TPR) repeat protein